MKLLRRRPPVQLLRIIAASTLLVAMGLGMMAFLRRFYHGHGWSLLFIFVLGLISDLVAEQELKEGITSERWPDAVISGPRRLHSAFFVLAWVLLVAGFVSIVISAISGARIVRLWCFLYPAMSFARVSSYLSPKPSSNDDSLHKPIETPKPLRSEHWGTAPHPFSN